MRFRSIISCLPAALIVFTLARCAGETKEAEPAAKAVVARFVSAGLGDVAPDSAVWLEAPEMTVSMLGQDLTDPKLPESALSEIRVRALSDTRSVAFRMEWLDSTRDAVDSGKLYSDAVAVQIPPAPGGMVPDSTMGQADKPVHIHLWKASYQDAVRLDEWSLNQTFPNATVDHYPFDAAGGDAKEELTEQYTIALAAGNPLIKKSGGGVDDLIAHGFGTLTHLPKQVSKGWSRWENGRWTVVILRPLSESEWPGGAGLKPGRNTFVAFAVWDGGKGQAGSRKMRSVWAPLELGGGS